MHRYDSAPAGIAGQAVTNVPTAAPSRLARPGGISDQRAAKADQRGLATRQDAIRLGRIGDAARAISGTPFRW